MRIPKTSKSSINVQNTHPVQFYSSLMRLPERLKDLAFKEI